MPPVGTLRTVVAELISEGHLRQEDLFDPEFEVSTAPGQHGLLLVRTSTRSLAVKRCAWPTAARRERDALRRLNEWRPTSFAVPELLSAADCVVITRSPPNLTMLPLRLHRRRDWTTAARAVGRSLAELHDSIPPHDDMDEAPTFNPVEVDPRVLGESPGVRVLTRDLQAAPGVHSCIEQLRSGSDSTPSTFIHGDIRGANILAARRKRLQPILVDWELSGVGPRWMDVGAAIAMFLEFAIEASTGTPPRPELIALLEQYCARSTAQLDLRAAVQWSGIRLLQSATEHVAHAVDLTPVAHRLVKLGSMLLTRPEESAIRLRLVA